MTERSRVDLTLLGQPLIIRTEAAPEYLRTLAAFIEERVTALRQSGVRDTMMALTLAALDIADELFRLRDEGVRREEEVGERLGALVSLIDSIAADSSEGGREGARRS